MQPRVRTGDGDQSIRQLAGDTHETSNLTKTDFQLVKAARSEMQSEAATPRSDLLSQLVAVGLGATAMYLLDPNRGKRRRHLLRDGIVRAAKETSAGIGTTGRDLANRSAGLAAVARRTLQRDSADDAVVADRVRTEVGRVVSHPGAIEVSVEHGRATLRGQVLASEGKKLVATVRGVRGVRDVVDHLERHDTAGDVPALQGDSHPASSRFELLQENWSPAARLLAGVAGGALATASLRVDGPLTPRKAILGLLGAALVVRSVTNMPFARLVGVGEGRRAVTVRKSITIAAPVDDVFNWLLAWERWPHWMSHVRQVRSHGASAAVGERTHWVVDGPAGTTVEWDAETTRFVPPALIAWQTVERSPVPHTGALTLTPTDAGATRLDVELMYTPIGGAGGQALATLLRRDPKHQLDDDLARLKTTIETGHPPQDAAIPVTLPGLDVASQSYPG
jgi:uncharacterized membrane protein